MTDLSSYYVSELRYLRQLTEEFRRNHPAAAQRLRIDPKGNSTDNNVERLLQSCALLGGRARAKIDDEFPELTDALLHVLYPHFLAPIPSMFIAQLDVDPTRLTTPLGFTVPRGSYMNSATSQPVACKFRTAYPVTLWPVRVAEARFQPRPFPPDVAAPAEARAALRIQLECLGPLNWSQLQLSQLRFYLHGSSQITGDLYEALFHRALKVLIRPIPAGGQPRTDLLEPANCLLPVGFSEKDEGLLPYSAFALLGYRLLTEFFTFPQKFQFFDLAGWANLNRSQFGSTCEVFIFFDDTFRSLEQELTADNLRLGCTPAVNLFQKSAESISVRPLRPDYRVVPDATSDVDKTFEVYSIERVASVDPTHHRTTTYPPFYSLQHEGEPGTLFWYPQRRRSLEPQDRGTEVHLAFTDLRFQSAWPRDDALMIETLCSNRDLPARIHAEGSWGDLRLEMGAPVRRTSALTPPTQTLRPAASRNIFWHLISQLSPNYLSIQHPVEAVTALRAQLKMYDFSDPAAGQQHLASDAAQMIDGITGVQSRRVMGRAPGSIIQGFCRGVEITVEFDRDQYTRTNVLLFAAVLERFFSLYATANSFTQLVARTRETVLKKWPPRVGAISTL